MLLCARAMCAQALFAFAEIWLCKAVDCSRGHLDIRVLQHRAGFGNAVHSCLQHTGTCASNDKFECTLAAFIIACSYGLGLGFAGFEARGVLL